MDNPEEPRQEEGPQQLNDPTLREGSTMPPRLERPTPQPLPGVQRIVAVGSGKGGVGKSTVSVNLALALAAGGLRVGIFDADIYGPNVPMMLGVRRPKTVPRQIYITTARGRPAEPWERLPTLERYGLRLFSIGLLVPDDTAVLPDPRHLGRLTIQLIRDINWGELDMLVLDLPPGTGEPATTLLQTLVLDGAIIVTTPQDLSLLDGGKALSMFQQAGVPVLGYVENMALFVCPCCGQEVEIFHRGERRREVQELPLLGRISLDPALSAANDTGRPVLITAPESAQAQAFREIAASLITALESLPYDGGGETGGESRY